MQRNEVNLNYPTWTDSVLICFDRNQLWSTQRTRCNPICSFVLCIKKEILNLSRKSMVAKYISYISVIVFCISQKCNRLSSHVIFNIIYKLIWFRLAHIIGNKYMLINERKIDAYPYFNIFYNRQLYFVIKKFLNFNVNYLKVKKLWYT